MHALIIEQDSWTSLMIEEVLRDLGYTSFDFACSADAAVAAAGARCPDLITSAIRLDSGRGIDAVRTICADRPIPVVFVTATPWEVREIGLGAAVVPKPFGQDMLREAIARATAAPAG